VVVVGRVGWILASGGGVGDGGERSFGGIIQPEFSTTTTAILLITVLVFVI